MAGSRNEVEGAGSLTTIHRHIHTCYKKVSLTICSEKKIIIVVGPSVNSKRFHILSPKLSDSTTARLGAETACGLHSAEYCMCNTDSVPR